MVVGLAGIAVFVVAVVVVVVVAAAAVVLVEQCKQCYPGGVRPNVVKHLHNFYIICKHRHE